LLRLGHLKKAKNRLQRPFRDLRLSACLALSFNTIQHGTNDGSEPMG
jgi:hypothetical protein